MKHDPIGAWVWYRHSVPPLAEDLLCSPIEAALPTTPAPTTPLPVRHGRIVVAGGVLAGLLVASLAFAAADEIHWTHRSPTAVTFSWRGGADSLRYGPTSDYGTTVFATTPVPLPFSSAGPFREARITGLTAATQYHYAIGDGADHTFTTAPARGASGFTIHALGDIGSTQYAPGVGPLQSVIAADAPAFVIALGDLTYGNVQGQASVDQHFNDVMAWSQEAAYMPVWGNHEWEAGDDLRNYKGRFDLPNPQTSAGSPAVSCCGEDWYWFDHGDTRFIAYPEPWTGARTAWNTQAQSLMAQAQADPAISYIVTFGHKPAYSAGPELGNTQLAGFQDALGAAYNKYVLDLSGHVHNYQRSAPISGVVHMVVGTGGRTLVASTGNPSWLAYRASHHGSMRLRFAADGIRGHLLCGPSSVLENVACPSGTVLDSFFIANPNLPPPPGAATFERRVSTGADDAEESATGGVSLTSGDLELVTDASAQTVAMRFASVSIPPGATIVSAYVQLTVDEVTTAATTLQIRAQAADHAPTLTSATRNLSNRIRTAASVAWSPAAWSSIGAAGAAQRTPDLAAPIAEVIGRAGWKSGNALGFDHHRIRKAHRLRLRGKRRARAAAPHRLRDRSAAASSSASRQSGAGGGRRARSNRDATRGGDTRRNRERRRPARSPQLAHQWVIAGPPGATILSPNATTTRVSFTTAGSYLARLTSSDGLLSGSDSARIEILPAGATPTVVDRRIAAGADDAEESSSGSVSLTSSDLELVTDGSAQTVAMRFTNLAIPSGATVTSAYIQFTVDETGSAATALTLRAQAADHAAALASSSRNLSNRARTTASVSWAPAAWSGTGAAGAAQRTPDLSGPIGEVIARTGWASGNALAILVTGTGKRTAGAFEGGAARAPLLHIEYSPAPLAGLRGGDRSSTAAIDLAPRKLLAFVAPSPLQGVGTLHLELPRSAEVRVLLYDVSGRLVRPILDGSRLEAGRHRIGFDPRATNGRAMAAGVYFLTVEAGGELAKARVIVLD